MTNNTINKKVYLLKKMISALEWDIPHIANKDLRFRKEEQLKQYKKELEELSKMGEEKKLNNKN